MIVGKKIMEENNNKPKKEKKKFNYILLIEILGIIALAGCLFEAIYQVVCYGACDEWCVLLCFVITVMLALAFFKKPFVYGKKPFRNRIILYVCSAVVFCIPNIVGEIVMYSTGKYAGMEEVTKLVTEKGLSLRSICAVRCLSEVMVIALFCAILAFFIDMMIRNSIKNNSENNR